MKSVLLALVAAAVASLPAFAGESPVVITSSAISPADVTVQRGDSVRISNADSNKHNVTIKASGADDADDTGLLMPGQARLLKFPESGTYRVTDGLHPALKLTVKVQ